MVGHLDTWLWSTYPTKSRDGSYDALVRFEALVKSEVRNLVEEMDSLGGWSRAIYDPTFPL